MYYILQNYLYGLIFNLKIMYENITHLLDFKYLESKKLSHRFLF